MIKKTLLQKLLSFSILGFFLAGCVTGPDGYLKRSANNKIFDTKGFKGGKRAPLYNKKYIAKAKKNVINDEYDDEYYEEEYNDESENVSRDNIEMYKMMIEEDLENNRKNSRTKPKRRSAYNGAYPSVVKARDRVNYNSHPDNSELRDEIDQIKALLEDAKKDLSSYKCPTAKSIESKDDNAAPSNRPKYRSDVEDLDDDLDSSIIEPVKSI